MNTFSAAMTEQLHKAALEHLIRKDHQEDLCFALWYPSDGRTRRTALVRALILPEAGDRRVHGNASFTSDYFERALFAAVREQAGLVFMHSHLGPGWQGMSNDDVAAETGHAAATLAATGLPLVGMTLGTDGAWSARFWEKVGPSQYSRRWCTNVRVVGDALTSTYNDALFPAPKFIEELTRTISAWGEKSQADLARTHMGFVGLGSVGQLVCENAVRTGVARTTIVDYDRMDFLNLDRSLYGHREHAQNKAFKAHIAAEAMRLGATAKDFNVLPVIASIAEEEGFRAALDSDVIVASVDRPWARSVLNFIAYAHLIPVVDGGIRVNTNRHTGALVAADWKAHTVTAGRACFACLGQYDPGHVSIERAGFLDDPTYIQGLPRDHALRRNENVFAFSMNTASMQFLQAIALIVAPLGYANQGQQMYHFVPGFMDEPTHIHCDAGCPFRDLIALGDRTGLVVTGRDERAERIRDGDEATPPVQLKKAQ